MLLRMLSDSEAERDRTYGFKRQIRELEQRNLALQSEITRKQRAIECEIEKSNDVRAERDQFSGQVDHLVKQVGACHAKIERLEAEIDARRAEGEKWQIKAEELDARRHELAGLLIQSSDEVRKLKAQNRTVCVRQMFVEVLPYQERNDRPTVPSEAAIRLQTRIDAEEFFEKLSALYKDAFGIAYAKDIVDLLAERGEIRKDLHDRLPEFADALADNAVTNEGFAVLFGIDLEPVFQEVHKSNMAKKDGPIDETGKRGKPEGWVGPDVIGVLRAQGWQPSSEAKVDEPIPYRLVPEFDECDLHGVQTSEGPCPRCENAQYNGSEVDPIAEGEAALASLAKMAAKVETGQQKVPTRHAVPIDRTIWTSTAKIEIPTALVLVGGVSTVCRVLFFISENERRLMIEFLANDELFGHWERRRQDKEVVDISVGGSALGKVRIESVERGRMQRDRAYVLQVEFVKAY
jgi:predicted HAD superfamily Cof-like phosphohydrolase